MYIVLGIHILLCIYIAFLYRRGKLKTRAAILPVVIMLPVWGEVLLLVEELMFQSKIGNKEIQMDSLKIADVKYKRIKIDADQNQNMTVPLEEAIILNDSKVRRSMLLDVLKNNPKDRIALLQKARNADDTELAHYATTTMMELQGEYEQNLSKYKKDFKRRKNIECAERYRVELTSYIKSQLISGNILLIYRRELQEVLDYLKQEQPDRMSYSFQSIENLLALKEYEMAKDNLDNCMKKWPWQEQIYRLYVDYYYSLGEQKNIKETLKLVKENNIYLSSAGKQWYEFWADSE